MLLGDRKLLLLSAGLSAVLMTGCISSSDSGSDSAGAIDLGTIGGSSNIKINDFSLEGEGVTKQSDGSYTLVPGKYFAIKMAVSGDRMNRRAFLQGRRIILQ